MVMGKRPDVPTAPAPLTALALAGFASRLGFALATVPLRKPWEGPESTLDNVGQSVTRSVMQAFFGYTTSLPQEQLRSVEVVLDDICRVVLPPFVHRLEVDIQEGTVGGVHGVWYVPRRSVNDLAHRPRGAILYLHGGGYIGTSPTMYAAFTGYLAHATATAVFVPDYRLAPEFPFPAALMDAISVYEALVAGGVDPARIVMAGDSGGGGLVTSLLQDDRAAHLPAPAAAVLFSPEVDLVLDEPSVSENAGIDILPARVPVEPYLDGHDGHDGLVSAIYGDLAGFPPTLVAFGDEELFRDPIRSFVQRLEEAGVETEVLEEPDMFHMYPILMPWAGASHRLYGAVRSFVDKHAGAQR
ncbi:MAG: alpha/beta hydrolase [Actinobacteria bacterium]|nr:alpha/beta hydrolase [Actinomycetota bacterium]